jgi:hypothetical protein
MGRVAVSRVVQIGRNVHLLYLLGGSLLNPVSIRSRFQIVYFEELDLGHSKTPREGYRSHNLSEESVPLKTFMVHSQELVHIRLGEDAGHLPCITGIVGIEQSGESRVDVLELLTIV